MSRRLRPDKPYHQVSTNGHRKLWNDIIAYCGVEKLTLSEVVRQALLAYKPFAEWRRHYGQQAIVDWRENRPVRQG